MAESMPDTTTPPPVAQTEREAFEHQYTDEVTGSDDWIAKDDKGVYLERTTQRAWWGWQARALLSQAVPAFDPTAKCSPTLTQCPRCKNPHHACDQHPVVAPVTDERQSAILESTQFIRDYGRELIENDWSLTGERLIHHALLIERALLAAQPPAQGDEALMRQPFEQAMKQAWQMVDPLNPSGVPGSYARGEHNGICAALKTVRENFEIALHARLEGTK
jgi:hypothetical protein